MVEVDERPLMFLNRFVEEKKVVCVDLMMLFLSLTFLAETQPSM